MKYRGGPCGLELQQPYVLPRARIAFAMCTHSGRDKDKNSQLSDPVAVQMAAALTPCEVAASLLRHCAGVGAVACHNATLAAPLHPDCRNATSLPIATSSRPLPFPTPEPVRKSAELNLHENRRSPQSFIQRVDKDLNTAMLSFWSQNEG